MHRWILFLESAHLPCPCLLPRILFITLPPRTRGTHAASDTWPVTRLLLITWQEGHFPVIRSTWENHKRLCLNYWYRWLLKSTIHQKETCYITKEWCYGHNVTALLDWAYCILLVWWLDEISLIACTSWQSQPGQLGVVWSPEATPWAGSIEERVVDTFAHNINTSLRRDRGGTSRRIGSIKLLIQCANKALFRYIWSNCNAFPRVFCTLSIFRT